jgi:hypothetical protein
VLGIQGRDLILQVLGRLIFVERLLLKRVAYDPRLRRWTLDQARQIE